MLTGICLVLAAGAAAPVFVPTDGFTLAWTHSIEKVRWEEDYAVVQSPEHDDKGTDRLVLQAVQARVRGSAAGMEPPADAHWAAGWYHYTPTQRTLPELRLMRSEFTADYLLCPAATKHAASACQPLAHWLSSDGGVTMVRPCQQAQGQTDGKKP